MHNTDTQLEYVEPQRINGEIIAQPPKQTELSTICR